MEQLTTSDKQRIEQEARLHYSANNNYPMEQAAFKKGAEYATIYERQQHKKWVDLTGELVESERAELRNKVIELTKDEYLKLIGAGPLNEPAYTIWETLQNHGYKITKAK